jgi:D-sedoheptulose 7-phosphate isomerase
LGLKKAIESSIQLKHDILSNTQLLDDVQNIIDLLVSTLSSRSKVFWCGNGGSAADAQHLSSELSGRFYKDRLPLNSEALHVNSSYLTAVANDFGFDEVYARALLAKATEGDVLICLTTSGKSPNILRAINQAKELNVKIVCFAGADGLENSEGIDYMINIPSNDTPRIQEAHMLLGHIVCEQIEANIFKE